MAVQDIREALITASMLVGNANAKLTHLRREKLISAINDNLTPLIQDESQFTDVAPYLFGSDFVKQAKEYLDQVGALKSTLTDIEHEENCDKRPLFCEGPSRRGNRPEKGAEDPSIKSKCTNRERGTSGGGHSNPRTEQYTHNSQCKNAMSNYKCHSVSDSCNGDNTPNHTSKSSGSAGTLSIKLGKSNKGPVGPKYSEGVRNRIFIKTPSNPKTLPCPTKPDPTGVGIPRDQRHDLKRGSDRVTDPTSGRVPLHPVSGAKERWRPETGDKFEKVKLFHNAPHFKMEGIHTLKSLLQKGDWLVKIDLKDTYFSVPISKEQRKFLCFQFRDRFYQFNCLPFGLASAPWVFTKTLKPIAALGRELGIRLIVYIDDILLMAETKEKARDQASGLIYLLQCLGFTVNMEKTVLDPSQYLEFLGFMVDTIKMELSLPAQKIKKIWAESRQILEAELVTARAAPLQIDWQNECHKPGDPTSSSVLQEPTNGPDNGSKESRPGLRDTSQFIPRQSGGTDLVGHPNDKMEWQDSISNGARPDHRIRRFIPRLGSVLPRHQHRGTLVSSGEEVAHQLPRTASSDSSTKNLCEEHEGTISIVEDRQHNSSCLHQQPRGNYIQGFDSSNQRSVDVVSREEHSHPSTIPTWSNEPGGRHGIEIHEGSIRLETGSSRFSENQQEVWSSGSGPVCNQINQPVPSLLQLAARSICRNNRRLSPGLDDSERFCQPTLEPSTESANKNTESRGISNSGSPSMEISAMVSPPTVITSRLAMPATQAGHGNRVSSNNAPTSRVEHLRERLDEQGLSSQATDLILNSWRTKTNKSYDSLFGRWNRWCTERGSDPFSGPVSEVANFLATLYQEGYQYNSVNAYRSAISSVHEKVDGVPVGQHPIVTRLVKGVFNVRPPHP